MIEITCTDTNGDITITLPDPKKTGAMVSIKNDGEHNVYVIGVKSPIGKGIELKYKKRFPFLPFKKWVKS